MQEVAISVMNQPQLKPIRKEGFKGKIPEPIMEWAYEWKFKLLNVIHHKKKLLKKEDLVFWWRNKNNFGDWITPYIYKKITGKNAIFQKPSNKSNQTVLMAIGSILQHTSSNSIVWGSGIMKRKVFFQEPNKTLCVRGPITRERFMEMGYDCPAVYGDPAILLPKFYSIQATAGDLIGIIPHNSDYELVLKIFPFEPFKVIDLRQDVEVVLEEIGSCSVIISSSLHGIIVPHAYGIPALWVMFSDAVPGDNVKFYDYYQSVGVFNLKPKTLNELPKEDELLRKIVLDFPQPKVSIEEMADNVLEIFKKHVSF